MKKMYSMINNRKGFTLVELIVVIAIIGILAAVAVPKITGVQADAKIKADNATIKTINSAIAIYCAKNDVETFVGAKDGLTSPTTIADGSTVDDVIKVLEYQKLIQPGAKLNSTTGWNYESDTNQVE